MTRTQLANLPDLPFFKSLNYTSAELGYERRWVGKLVLINGLDHIITVAEKENVVVQRDMNFFRLSYTEVKRLPMR